jgi:hypothetical protein
VIAAALLLALQAPAIRVPGRDYTHAEATPLYAWFDCVTMLAEHWAGALPQEDARTIVDAAFGQCQKFERPLEDAIRRGDLGERPLQERFVDKIMADTRAQLRGKALAEVIMKREALADQPARKPRTK